MTDDDKPGTERETAAATPSGPALRSAAAAALVFAIHFTCRDLPLAHAPFIRRT